MTATTTPGVVGVIVLVALVVFAFLLVDDELL